MPPRRSPLSAQDLIRDVVEHYAQMSSYQDMGVVRQWFNAKAPPLETTFSTSFKKPSLFRFEFASPHPYPPLRHIITTHVIGSDGTTAYTLVKEHEATARVEIEESLSMAVAGATGISSGSAHTIGRLLLPEVGGLSLMDLVRPSRKQDRSFLGAVCYCIDAKHPRGPTLELWIEKNTLLLRKLVQSARKNPSEELRQGIRVDQLVKKSIFAKPKK